ncbi:MAG: aminopeptidase N [Chromatiales bacterium]|nr:aminopeptidase N [Gammaproteobacteria bacterium]MCP5352335.1 aminopeptidase N [Chromatiales bacterium]
MTTTPRTIQLADYQPPAHLIDRIDLVVRLDDDVTEVTARSRVRRNPVLADDEAPPLHLDGQDMELVSLAVDGERVHVGNYRLGEESLVINEVPDEFELVVVTRIKPQDNSSLEGLYRSNDLYCTQCEAEGFRKITYYPDRPDVMARFTTRIEADAARFPVLLSNGNLIEQGALADGRHFATWEDPFPKPCYLYALVAGDLQHIEDRYTTASGREVTLRIFVEPQNIDRCQHAMDSLKKSMRWDEQTYGREYDLDVFMIVAVNDFNMGAMENKGLNIFNAKYILARPDTATDMDYLGIEGVVAHEYFHNWTGNRITCRDWFQLSLKEGLTVFRDQEFSADMNSRGVKRIEDVRMLRQFQFREDAGPMAHPVRPASYIEINNFYTVTVYEKGAEVVRMQHTLLGADGYRKGTDLYFERHDGQAVTTDDFVRCMEDANGVDLGQFRLWYSQAGTPRVIVEAEYDAETRTYTLLCSQTCPPTPDMAAKAPMHIPLAIGLVGPDGADLPLRLLGESEASEGTRVLELRAPIERFDFVDVAVEPVPSLLRGFSAPVHLEFDYSDAQLRHLLAHDSDEFSRWEAGQVLVTRLILELAAERAAGRTMRLNPDYVAAFGMALRDESLAPDYRAELIRLPSEATLAEAMKVIDVDGIHAAREFVRHELAAALSTDLIRIHQALSDDGAYSPDAASIGRRSLRNACLSYLSCLPEGIELAHAQFEAGANMTDTMAALTALAHHANPHREHALAVFRERWRADPLVLDKWFSLQATAPLPDTLAQVRALETDPAYDPRNPNRIRSLIGAFCAANPVNFHAADGAGYRFLADHVLDLDSRNPQIAARLLGNLAHWRRYDAGRGQLMRAELARIVARHGLSRDCYEVASKSLAER